jgi:rhodanese-related sulfurtransferase
MPDSFRETLPHCTREELRRKIEQGEPIVLVDALSPTSYAHSHLPGAINLPPELVDDFATLRIPDRSAEVIVYCASVDCDSSVDTARKLLALGFTNVSHYEGGKRDWIEASLPVEGGARRRAQARQLKQL